MRQKTERHQDAAERTIKDMRTALQSFAARKVSRRAFITVGRRSSSKPGRNGGTNCRAYCAS